METSAGLLPDCMGPTQIIWDRLPSLKSTDSGLWSRLQNTSTATLTICCSGGSVAKSCVTLGNPMNCSTPGFPVLHNLPEFAQTYVHSVNDAIQPSDPLSPTSPLALNISQNQSLFQRTGFLQQVAKGLELQLQHQSFQWMFRVISFRIDWFDLLAVQGTLKSLLQHHGLKASILQHSAFFVVQLTSVHDY